MAFPVLLQKLFKNFGAGSQLNNSILPPPTSTELGAVRAGANVTIDANGVISADGAVKTVNNVSPDSNGNIAITSVTKATQDASGNVITSTYLTKTDASNTYLGKSSKATSATSADSATKATQDASGNVITSTYETKANAIVGLSVSGKTITYTKGDSTTGTITTQDTNTTYSSGTGISVGSDNKINLATVVTAGNGGPTANASPDFSGTFTVPYFEYDAYGRITARTNRTITLPAKPATDLPNIGAKNFSASVGLRSGYYSVTFTVARDAYGRVTNFTKSTSNDCAAQCD